MKTLRRLVFCGYLIIALNLIFMVNSATCQVNESELAAFFKHPQYRKHRSTYYKTAKSYIELQLKKYPKGSPSYKQMLLMRKALVSHAPEMQAPPFLNVNTCAKGDLGMMSLNGRFIPYVKIFQILDDQRALMKCSFNPSADDDDWSGPFLWVAKKGTAWSDGNPANGKILALGVISFKKIDNYQYKNVFGALRTVPAVEVIGSDVWAAMVKKHKK
jgi:hypothetical protein